jgi:YgiT-type zinc finger domain-containing protein
MAYVKKCPLCGGGEVVEKEVTEVICGGPHTAIVSVSAGVCRRCGERIYTPETIRRFETIEAKLERHELSGFQPMGQSFHVDSPGC